jgi:hypothetical protein
MKPLSLPAIRRIVTGHDATGKAIIASAGPLPGVHAIAAIPGTVFHEVWSTSATPAPLDNGPDPTTGALCLPPPPGGSRVRFVDIPPDSAVIDGPGALAAQQAFAQIGDANASTVKADSPHPLMHRTETIDYGIVIAGELTLVLDEGEVALAAGSVVVQRGTNHAWANRSGQVCRMLFVLICGSYDPSILRSLEDQ